MIEVVLNGFFVREPHQVGAVISSPQEGEIARIRRGFSAGDLRSWSAAEIATLVAALEELLRRHLGGEEVLVRTGLSRLVDVARGMSGRATEDALPWIDRLRAIAPEFAEIRAVVSLGWVTVPAQDLALRAVLERVSAVDHITPMCPSCGGRAASRGTGKPEGDTHVT